MRTGDRCGPPALALLGAALLCREPACAQHGGGPTAGHSGARVVYSFQDHPGIGGSPSSQLTADAAGDLYGVTPAGGDLVRCPRRGCGTVFRLLPPRAFGAGWTMQTLYEFARGTSGARPLGQLLLDGEGDLYGTSLDGGRAVGGLGSGTVWKLSRPKRSDGAAWSLSILYTFGHTSTPAGGGPDGGHPAAGVVMDRAGTLYGTTVAGGAQDSGVVFSLAPPAPGATNWMQTVLHSFGGSGDAATPAGPVALSSDQSWLFGATDGSVSIGGSLQNGSVYGLHRVGNAWDYAALYGFSSQRASLGFLPGAGLLVDRRNDLFGTTGSGGDLGDGTVFELSPPAAGQSLWTEQVLHSFGGVDGAFPAAPLLAAGRPAVLYGTAAFGGDFGAADGSHGNAGVTFRLDPPSVAGGTWTYTPLHAFGAAEQGARGAGALRTGLTVGRHRRLFGVASYGGAHGDGAVYSQTAN